MKTIVMVLFVSTFCANVALAEERYDFRKSDAYSKLSKEDRTKLEQVHRDFMMLWGPSIVTRTFTMAIRPSRLTNWCHTPLASSRPIPSPLLRRQSRKSRTM